MTETSGDPEDFRRKFLVSSGFQNAPEAAKEHFQRGDRAYVVERKTRVAKKEFLAALKIWPQFAMVHWRLGQIEFHARPPRYQRALEAFRNAVVAAPDWSEGHLCSAHAIEQLGRLEDAVFEYEEAIRLLSADPRARISFGRCLVELGQLDRAVEEFKAGIALRPAYGLMDAKMMLADALRRQGQIAEAAAEWREIACMKAVWSYERQLPAQARRLLSKYAL